MKKILIAFLISLIFMGCGYTDINNTKIDQLSCHYVFDANSRIIYVRTPYSVAPYYSENEKLCRYIDGEIVEVNQ